MVKPPLRTKSIGFKVSEEEYAQLESAAQADGRTLGEWCREAIDLLPVFRTSPSMISDEGKGKGYVEEQAHGSADDRGAEATRGGS